MSNLPHNDSMAQWLSSPTEVSLITHVVESELDANELAGLAMEADIESVIVSSRGPSNGPFDEQQLTGLGDNGWTLCIKAVDNWSEEAQKLVNQLAPLPYQIIDSINGWISASEAITANTESDKFWLVLEGQLSGRVNGQVFNLEPGTALFVEQGSQLELSSSTLTTAIEVDLRTITVGSLLAEVGRHIDDTTDSNLTLELAQNIHSGRVAAAALNTITNVISQLQDNQPTLAACLSDLLTDQAIKDIDPFDDRIEPERLKGFHRDPSTRYTYFKHEESGLLLWSANGLTQSIEAELQSLVIFVCEHDYFTETDIEPYLINEEVTAWLEDRVAEGDIAYYG